MQQLVRAGILRGVRGPRGGYRLARERRRITVGQVVRVIQGSEEQPEEPGPVSESDLGRQVMAPFWLEIEQELMRRLDDVTVEELCQKAGQAGIESDARRGIDFVI
jgi:Rrf2 family protein